MESCDCSVRVHYRSVASLGVATASSKRSMSSCTDSTKPPFGHIAEDELDRLAKKAGLPDGFNGNAQSFRIAAKLTMGDAVTSDSQPMRGLNLSRATLDGILKYPW